MAHGHHKWGQITARHKARHHKHEFRRFIKLNGREMEICKYPKCRELHYVT